MDARVFPMEVIVLIRRLKNPFPPLRAWRHLSSPSLPIAAISVHLRPTAPYNIQCMFEGLNEPHYPALSGLVIVPDSCFV